MYVKQKKIKMYGLKKCVDSDELDKFTVDVLKFFF